METTTPQGACKGFPTQWWFPEDNGRDAKLNVLKAIDICKMCKIIKPCLDYALRNETHGVWGGMKEVEREIYRRKNNILLSPEAKSSQSTSTRRIRRRMTKEEANAE